MKKPKSITEKPVSKIKTEAKAKQPAATSVAQAKPKKPSPAPKAPKKAQAAASKPIAAKTPKMTVSERIGLTAGSIWHYLADNGDTSVATLVRELPEEEKVIQRSIGWLAQEGKIALATVNQAETLALKNES